MKVNVCLSVVQWCAYELVIMVEICWLQAISDEQREILDKVTKDCSSENALSADEVQNIHNNPKGAVSNPKAQV